MINQSPIFLNCFSRGGSNILWNIFLSHPDVCSPIQETVEIFRVGRQGTATGLKLALRSGQWHLFDQKNLKPRKPLSLTLQNVIDDTLYQRKLQTYTDEEMKYKSHVEVYKLAEVQQARLVAKNNNGLAFLKDIFRTMYPDAVFFGLVRSPLALYESYARRGFIHSLVEFAAFYCAIGQKMLQDAENDANYHIVRFEDILIQPIETIERLYTLANLDFSLERKIRFKAKSHFNERGDRTTEYKEGQHYWFDWTEVTSFLEPNINEFQIDRLSAATIEELRQRTQAVASLFGYDESD